MPEIKPLWLFGGIGQSQKTRQNRDDRAIILNRHPEYGNHTKRFDVIALGDQRRWIEGAFSVEDLILS
jgi:hypothetical protein